MSDRQHIELSPEEDRENTKAVIVHVIPFAIWLTMMVWLGDPTGWKYAARSIAGLVLILAFRPWRWYPRLQLKNIPAALGVGRSGLLASRRSGRARIFDTGDSRLDGCG